MSLHNPVFRINKKATRGLPKLTGNFMELVTGFHAQMKQLRFAVVFCNNSSKNLSYKHHNTAQVQNGSLKNIPHNLARHNAHVGAVSDSSSGTIANADQHVDALLYHVNACARHRCVCQITCVDYGAR